MNQFSISAFLVMILVCASVVPVPTSAQTQDGVEIHLGLSAGFDGVPAPLRGGCVNHTQRRSDLDGGEVLGVRVGAQLVGPIGVELRGSFRDSQSLICANPNSPDEPSSRPLPFEVYHERSTVDEGGTFVDARLRLQFGEDSRTVVTLGPGMVAGGPLLVSGSVGHLWGTENRVGLEVGVTAFKMPWRSWSTTVFQNPDDPEAVLQSDPIEEDFARWQLGIGIQGVIEFDVLILGS